VSLNDFGKMNSPQKETVSVQRKVQIESVLVTERISNSSLITLQNACAALQIYYYQDSLKKNGPKREIFIADTLLPALTEKLGEFPSLWKDVENHFGVLINSHKNSLDIYFEALFKRLLLTMKILNEFLYLIEQKEIILKQLKRDDLMFLCKQLSCSGITKKTKSDLVDLLTERIIFDILPHFVCFDHLKDYLNYYENELSFNFLMNLDKLLLLPPQSSSSLIVDAIEFPQLAFLKQKATVSSSPKVPLRKKQKKKEKLEGKKIEEISEVESFQMQQPDNEEKAGGFKVDQCNSIDITENIGEEGNQEEPDDEISDLADWLNLSNLSSKRNDVFTYRHGIDGYSLLPIEDLSRQEVDHIIERQFLAFSIVSTKELPSSWKAASSSSTSSIKETVNDSLNLTLTTSSINSSKGQIWKQFLKEEYQTQYPRDLLTILFSETNQKNERIISKYAHQFMLLSRETFPLVLHSIEEGYRSSDGNNNFIPNQRNYEKLSERMVELWEKTGVEDYEKGVLTRRMKKYKKVK
jgi:hypothetical protein